MVRAISIDHLPDGSQQCGPDELVRARERPPGGIPGESMTHPPAPIARILSAFALTSIAAFVMLLASGCDREYPNCKRDRHCKEELGEKCVEGICQNCVTNEDCRGKGPNGSDLQCIEYRCGEGGQSLLPGGLGSPCASINECNEGLVCRGGECSLCLADAECPSGSCNLDTGLCNASNCNCQTADDCAMEEMCIDCQCRPPDPPDPVDEDCGMTAVYFDFDSPKLSSSALSALSQAAECIAAQNRVVNLEAHADPRGTEEYNILLTDKRGQSVKNYLRDLGVPAHMLNVVAKGDLEAEGTDESSWARDRRVQFVWQ